MSVDSRYQTDEFSRKLFVSNFTVFRQIYMSQMNDVGSVVSIFQIKCVTNLKTKRNIEVESVHPLLLQHFQAYFLRAQQLRVW